MLFITTVVIFKRFISIITIIIIIIESKSNFTFVVVADAFLFPSKVVWCSAVGGCVQRGIPPCQTERRGGG